MAESNPTKDELEKFILKARLEKLEAEIAILKLKSVQQIVLLPYPYIVYPRYQQYPMVPAKEYEISISNYTNNWEAPYGSN